MGQLFTKMATVWLDQQRSAIMKQNRSFVTLKPIVTKKRKRIDYDDKSNKRKVIINSRINNDTDDEDRLSLSPRVSPIIQKITKSSGSLNQSLSSMKLFKCQLCCRCLKNKDTYLDHMMMCAAERQMSIKIIRADKDQIYY